MTTPVGFGVTSPTAGGVIANGNGSGNGNGNGAGGGGGSAVPSSAVSKGGISSGAIAGIVISLTLVLIGATVFFIRRRHKARQNARRAEWMRYRNEALHGTGFSSTRSSFASPGLTNEEMESSFIASSMFIPPGGQQQSVPPQIAELTLPPIAVLVDHSTNSHSRGSVYSIGSDSSGADGQASYAQVNLASGNTTDIPLRSPMSVRPFTPSESWIFPKPPNGGSENPQTTRHDPFAEPSGIETIKRPFVPTLDDELSVVPGDRIRILNTYDDGWSVVEKINKATGNVVGLIPIACLRSAGEQPSTFVSSKRLSSYDDMADAPRAL
jgi:Variant SH3 domain